jgi:hypothetical protein
MPWLIRRPGAALGKMGAVVWCSVQVKGWPRAETHSFCVVSWPFRDPLLTLSGCLL